MYAWHRFSIEFYDYSERKRLIDVARVWLVQGAASLSFIEGNSLTRANWDNASDVDKL